VEKMNTIKYLNFNKANPKDFLPFLNNQKVREHLIEHELFDLDSVKTWIDSKIDVDSTPGCKVRMITFNDQLAGWCGIQLEDGKYEIAIVIDEQFWGLGKTVFQDMMGWAKELGHDEVFIHFLHTRPDYKFLQKIAKNVYKTDMLGSQFTTYQLAVE
jgi:hypothetical protein